MVRFKKTKDNFSLKVFFLSGVHFVIRVGFQFIYNIWLFIYSVPS